MAHMTKEFRRRIIFPLIAFILFFISLIVIFSILINWILIFTLIPMIILTYITIKEISIKMYKSIKLNSGIFEYFPEKYPFTWHKKMGYLRLLEIITPQDCRINLYRKCDANIGNNVVLAGKILEPDMTTIGANTVIGVDALITAHEIILQKEQIVIRLKPIEIGKNCVIGAKSIILPGVIIPPRTMIPACSVVKKDRKSYICTSRGDK